MASHSDLIVIGDGEQFEKYAPAEYMKLTADPARKEQIIPTVTATETLEITEEFCDQPKDIEITKKDDSKDWLPFIREWIEFLPSRAIIQQYASICVEAVLLVRSAVGISITPGDNAIKEVVNEAVQAIRSSSKLVYAVKVFVAAWGEAGDKTVSKALVFVNLITEINVPGILWTIIKSLCSNMERCDWLLIAAKVTAMIIALLATGEFALIAKIAIVVLRAVNLARKIANIIQLS